VGIRAPTVKERLLYQLRGSLIIAKFRLRDTIIIITIITSANNHILRPDTALRIIFCYQSHKIDTYGVVRRPNILILDKMDN
jgi:hypothetical protein